MISGDYISRADAIVQKCDCEAYNPKTGMIFECEAVPVERINAIPPADVRPVVRGHWVWNPNGMDWGLGAWCCDQCRIKAETWWANDRKNNPLRCSGGRFCGNCGAKMGDDPDAIAKD